MTYEINRYLDAAVLKPEMSQKEVEEAIVSTLPYAPATLCVRPCDIALTAPYCQGTQTGVCTVLGFPHGCQLTASKVDETKRYLSLGVQEIDMVANFGYVRSQMWSQLHDEIAQIAEVCHKEKVPLKVIFETCYLNNVEITKLTEICIAAKADFIKTSTGFGTSGATDEGVKTMLEAASGRIKIKPSGGIRDTERARHLISLGVHRLGVNYAAVPAICGTSEGAGKPIQGNY